MTEPRICAVTHCSLEAKAGHVICLRCQRTYEQVAALKHSRDTQGAQALGQSDEAFERALRLSGA